MIRRIDDDALIFLDETGFNLHTLMEYGYSREGAPAYITDPGNRGRKISLLCAISVNGVIAHKIIR